MSRLSVLYEDNHLLAINKQAGVLVQGDRTGDTPLVEHAKKYLKEKYQKPGDVFLGVVHRIDRPVTGVVLFARTSKSLERMTRLFRERKVSKRYLAIVKGRPPLEEGSLVHWLKKNESTNRTTFFTRETEGALRAELTYRLIRTAGDRSLLEIRPLTGRSHQIRVQCSAMGCPIVGDLKYEGPKGRSSVAIDLHAESLTFGHPTTGETIVIKAPVPDSADWQSFESRG